MVLKEARYAEGDDMKSKSFYYPTISDVDARYALFRCGHFTMHYWKEM